jgi:hypothetical protein
MRIVDIRERPISISRYRDPHIPSGGLTTSLVAVVTDAARQVLRDLQAWQITKIHRLSAGRWPGP